MKDFDELYSELLESNFTKTEFLVEGKEKTVKGMVLLVSKNSPDSSYIKAVFTDGSFLLILIQDKQLCYADKLLGRLENVSDEEIGKLEQIVYKDKTYKLVNKDDYQYVLHRYIGRVQDVEGEARFSNYLSNDGEESLSLGWLSETGERADVYCKSINVEDVKIL
jgi:hypothetical protein